MGVFPLTKHAMGRPLLVPLHRLLDRLHWGPARRFARGFIFTSPRGTEEARVRKLLTKAEASNPQVDPGKQAVQNAEAWAKANGVTLTDQQKDSIAKSARQQAAPPRL